MLAAATELLATDVRIWNGVLWTMPTMTDDQEYPSEAASRVMDRTAGIS